MRWFDELDECAERLGNDGVRATLRGIAQWYDSPAAHVVVCGEFKRGKSSLVNALLGVDICPTDALPATAVPTVIRWSAVPEAVLQYEDGRQVALAPTAKALSALSVGGAVPAEQVRFVNVGLPCALLREGIVLIDTPGVNDLSRQRADVTYRFLPMADAVVVVLDATAPVTRTEVLFLTEQVLPGTRDRLVFVLGKVDRLEDDEVPEAIEGATQRLTELLGRSVEVVPGSARRASRGDPNALQSVTEALDQVVKGCAAERGDRLRSRLLRVSRALTEEAQARVASLEATPAERAEAQARLDSTLCDLEQRFSAVRAYVAQYGEATLRDLVAASLTKVHRDLEEDLLHQLASLQAGIPAFVEQQVPYRVALRLRQWGEAKGPEIEAFLHRFIERVAQDFAAQFAAPLELSGLPRALATPSVSAETQAAATNRTQEALVGRLLPVALPIAAGMILFGPLGAVAGSLIGQLAVTHLEGTKVDAQRSEARGVVEHALHAAFDGFQAGLDSEITKWFEQLNSCLREAMDSGRARSMRLLVDPRAGEAQTLREQISRLSIIQIDISSGATP